MYGACDSTAKIPNLIDQFKVKKVPEKQFPWNLQHVHFFLDEYSIYNNLHKQT